MPTIVIKNLNNRRLQAPNNNSLSVLNIIHDHHIDWMFACGAKGRCTTCKMIVVEGQEHLPPLNEVENKYFQKGLLRPNERLACQVKLNQDLVIEVPDQNKFPHISYSY